MSIKTENVTIDALIEKVSNYDDNEDDLKLIRSAYEYAAKKHFSQKRITGDDYITHPLNVAWILTEVKADGKAISAALLHDTIEDSDSTFQEIESLFGQEVASIVDGVTKINRLNFNSDSEQMAANQRKILVGLSSDVRVLIVKLADRLHNMRTLKYLKRERQIANAKETMDLYAPLANRLGIYSLKWELEDLGFRYLHPEEYRELVEGIEKKREERLEFINKITDEIKLELKKQNIDAEIKGRAKHLYSIDRKMKRDNITLDQVYDLFALRIIVNSVKDCYAALGVVHDLYTPMPGRFKDYIAVPKPNMYQSIHTTLLGPNGTPFEVQVRTWDMHQVAEFGIAAHWAYKEANNKSGKKSNVAVTDDKLAWLRETLEWQKDMQDPEEFLKTLKTELFEKSTVKVTASLGLSFVRFAVFLIINVLFANISTQLRSIVYVAWLGYSLLTQSSKLEPEIVLVRQIRGLSVSLAMTRNDTESIVSAKWPVLNPGTVPMFQTILPSLNLPPFEMLTTS